jgi:hypothetical protein
MITAYVGDLAYLFSSTVVLVPVKTLDWHFVAGKNAAQDGKVHKNSVMEVRVTATRGSYRRGETLHVPLTSVAPRRAVKSKEGKLIAIRPYEWKERT